MFNGLTLLLEGSEQIGKYINLFNKEAVEEVPKVLSITMVVFAISFLTSAVLLIISLIRGEFVFKNSSKFLNTGILLAIAGLMFFGFSVRMISNHQAAANVFYYFGLLYFFRWFVERNTSAYCGLDKIKLLPIYGLLLYTMGQPGFQKIFNSNQVMPKYISMFQDSFLSKLPGGVESTIYFLGFAEIIVPVLLIISLMKKEFLPNRSKFFLTWVMFISALTFVMLSFGLAVISNYPGSTNLVFYAIFILGFYAYISETENKKETRAE